MMDTDRLPIALSFANRLSADTQTRLCQQVRILSMPPRAPLLQPGDSVSGAYFVESGSIRVYYLDADGHEGTLYRIESGKSCILALNCLFSEMRYPAWAEAGDEGVTFATLDGAAASSFMAMDSDFMKAMFEQVSTRLYDLLRSLEQAIRLPLEARLIGMLLDLSNASDEIHLSQERLAAHLGTSREVVSRIIRSLASDKLLTSAYGKIVLTNKEGLVARVN